MRAENPRPSGRGVVNTHSLPLREQGSWAEQLIAAAEDVAPLPSGAALDAAAALPIPALTADQAWRAVHLEAGQTVLVHGAGGVTGGLLVQLAAYRRARVLATAGGGSAARVLALGADRVLDYHRPDWPEQVRSLTGGGADADANAVRSGAPAAMRAVRDGGALATITAGAPAAERGITVLEIQVVPDGDRLSELARLLAAGAITVAVGDRYPLGQAGAALARARQGTHGAVVVLEVAR